jgi:hypothetical protein
MYPLRSYNPQTILLLQRDVDISYNLIGIPILDALDYNAHPFLLQPKHIYSVFGHHQIGNDS